MPKRYKRMCVMCLPSSVSVFLSIAMYFSLMSHLSYRIDRAMEHHQLQAMRNPLQAQIMTPSLPPVRCSHVLMCSCFISESFEGRIGSRIATAPRGAPSLGRVEPSAVVWAHVTQVTALIKANERVASMDATLDAARVSHHWVAYTSASTFSPSPRPLPCPPNLANDDITAAVF